MTAIRLSPVAPKPFKENMKGFCVVKVEAVSVDILFIIYCQVAPLNGERLQARTLADLAEISRQGIFRVIEHIALNRRHPRSKCVRIFLALYEKRDLRRESMEEKVMMVSLYGQRVRCSFLIVAIRSNQFQALHFRVDA